MDNPRKVIQPIVKVSDEEKAKRKAPEMRAYLICFMYNDEATSWVEAIGRTEAYDVCRTTILAGDIDVEGSIVLAEGVEYGKHATLYQFMKHMENFFNDPNNKFDIDDYVVGDAEVAYTGYDNSDFDVQSPIDVTSGNVEGEDI